MRGRDPLAHDPAGDRDELEVDVRDAFAGDAARDGVDGLGPAGFVHELFEIRRHG